MLAPRLGPNLRAWSEPRVSPLRHAVPPMSSTGLVTDADLARARSDPAFRNQLVSDSLELLLGRLNRMRGSESDAKSAREMREAVKLAVKLADLLQRTGEH
jgi:hypothetical protein